MTVAPLYLVKSAPLGSTTLPDSRGRTGFALNQGVARLTSAISLDGNTRFTGGGDQNYQAHIHTVTVTDPGHTHVTNALQGAGVSTPGGGFPCAGVSAATIFSAVTGITAAANSNGIGTAGNVPPAFIYGLKLIRAG